MSSGKVKNPLTGKDISVHGKTALKLLGDHQNKKIKLPEKTVKMIKAAKKMVGGAPPCTIETDCKEGNELIDQKGLGLNLMYNFSILPNDIQTFIREKYFKENRILEVLLMQKSNKAALRNVITGLKRLDDLNLIAQLSTTSKGISKDCEKQTNEVLDNATPLDNDEYIQSMITLNPKNDIVFKSGLITQIEKIRKDDYDDKLDEKCIEAYFWIENGEEESGQIEKYLNHEDCKKWERLWVLSTVYYYILDRTENHKKTFKYNIDILHKKIERFLGAKHVPFISDAFQTLKTEIVAGNNLNLNKPEGYPDNITLSQLTEYLHKLPWVFKAIYGY